MKRLAIVAVVIVLAAAGYYFYQRYQTAQAAAASNFETVAVTKSSLTATIGGTGTVRTNQTTLLAWQTTGNVATVKVTEGQQVKKGDILAELDPLSLSQEIILAQADLVTAQRDLQNLLDSKTAAAQAQLNLANAQKALDDAERARNQLNNSRVTQDTIDVAKADLLLAQEEVDRLQDIFDQVSSRSEDDPVRATALSNLAAAKQERDRLQRNYNWMIGDSSDQEITEADAELALAQAQLEDAQREYDRLKDGPDPNDVAAAEARVTALQATQDLAHLVAPFDGTITHIAIKPGDQVTLGTEAFRLDDMTHLLVDVPISEVDINNIAIDQDASLTFDAIQTNEYHGMVSEVARVGTTVEGIVNFTVTIEITDADEDVRPGMTAAVNVVVANVEDVLVVPNRAVRSKDGQRVVYILKNGQLQAVPIELGSSSDTYSEVLSGDLQEGDRVVLNPPSEMQSGGGSFFGGQ